MSRQTSQAPTPHEILYAHVREWKYCDVLIDRMTGFPFQNEIEALGDPVVHQCMLTDPIFAASSEQAPILVRLPWTQLALLEKYLTYALQEAADPDAQMRTVCAFLFSPLTQPKLAKLLTRQLDISVQDVGNIYFRYFDPRVMRHLSPILDSNQLTSLLHGIQTWLYVDWAGQLNAITAEHREFVPRLVLTATQWQQMQDVEAFNLAQRLLRKEDYRDGKSATEIEIHLFTAVRHAKMAGLAIPEDQATFAAYALKFGKTFTQHAGLANAIHTAVQHDVPFADALVHYADIMPDATALLSISD